MVVNEKTLLRKIIKDPTSIPRIIRNYNVLLFSEERIVNLREKISRLLESSLFYKLTHSNGNQELINRIRECFDELNVVVKHLPDESINNLYLIYPWTKSEGKLILNRVAATHIVAKALSLFFKRNFASKKLDIEINVARVLYPNENLAVGTKQYSKNLHVFPVLRIEDTTIFIDFISSELIDKYSYLFSLKNYFFSYQSVAYEKTPDFSMAESFAYINIVYILQKMLSKNKPIPSNLAIKLEKISDYFYSSYGSTIHQPLFYSNKDTSEKLLNRNP